MIADVPEQRYPCPFCDLSFLNVDTIISHAARDHDPSLKTSKAVFGVICPACGEEFERLAQHCSRTHRRSVAMLLQQAAAGPDSHGAAQALRERFTDLQLSQATPEGAQMAVWGVEVSIEDEDPEMYGPYTQRQAERLAEKLMEEVALATTANGLNRHPRSITYAGATPLAKYDWLMSGAQRQDLRALVRAENAEVSDFGDLDVD